MINGVSNYDLSANTEYLTKQIDCISPDKFDTQKRSMLLLGCGDGVAMKKLALLHSDWFFVGVDFNASYIREAQSDCPHNATFICSSFSQLSLPADATFGVIASPGLLSWIPKREFEAVICIVQRFSEKGSYASFGFDNSYFWSELTPIRETFLSSWLESGNLSYARIYTQALVRQMVFSSQFKREFVNDCFENEVSLAHWLLQPHWFSFFPSEIEKRFQEIGFARLNKGTDEATSDLICPNIYNHWDFKRLV